MRERERERERLCSPKQNTAAERWETKRKSNGGWENEGNHEIWISTNKISNQFEEPQQTYQLKHDWRLRKWRKIWKP